MNLRLVSGKIIRCFKRNAARAAWIFLMLEAQCAIVYAQANINCSVGDPVRLDRTLIEMINKKAGIAAYKCINEAASNFTPGSDLIANDDIRYLLANRISDAIESLGGSGNVESPYHTQAAIRWQEYIKFASEPFDGNRAAFAAEKLIQHAAYANIEYYIGDLVESYSRGANSLSRKQAEIAFVYLRRCPNWRTPRTIKQFLDQKDNACATPCKELFMNFTNKLRPNLGKFLNQEMRANVTSSMERLQCN